MKILGIETSCDETAAAVVEDGANIISNIVASSSHIQQKYGGVVPEIAARKQVESIIPVLTESLSSSSNLQPHHPTSHLKHLTLQLRSVHASQIDAIAVTVGPGLIGSLLVGVETAKALAFAWNKPIIPVNHIHAHIYANFISHGQMVTLLNGQKTIQPFSHLAILFPAIALVASGGHTELFLMKNERDIKWLGGTLDDAAGEAFDKIAKLLSLPYPGGPSIAAEAAKFRISNFEFRIKLPRPMIYEDNLNFSFSGLKTAVIREVEKLKTMKQWNNETMKQFAFETQEAITDVLVAKTVKAAQKYNVKSILISGGVAANTRLREKFNQQLTTHNTSASLSADLQLIAPSVQLCTDNAAAIAACAYFLNKPVNWKTITANPNLSVE